MVFVQSVTSLGGVTLRVIVVCPRLPPGHSFRACAARFRQAEVRSARLPINDDSLPFGIVSDNGVSRIYDIHRLYELTGKPFRAFHG